MLNEVCSVPLVAVTSNGYDVPVAKVVPMHPPHTQSATLQPN
jgi:hypothetical protein